MKKLFSNTKFVLGAGLAFVFASGLASYLSGHWHWFGRSGSVFTIAGLLLTFRPLVRMGLADWLKSLSTIDCGHIPPTAEEIEVDRQTELDGSAARLGGVIAVIGTIIWAYGDLVGGLPR